jgi:gluconolactonase
MRSRATLVTVICLVGCARCCAGAGAPGTRGRPRRRGGRGGQEAAQPPATDKVTPEIPGIVKAGTKIEIVASGLRGSDAGVGTPDGGFIATANGGVVKFDADGKMTTLVEDSEQAAGSAMDSKGRLIGAQYTKKVSVLYPKGSEETLTSSFDGKPYIRPNDIVVDKKGGVYFTDCYQIGATRSPNDLPQSVYYIRPIRRRFRVADDIRRPNGIVLSPDEKTLYVNDWDSPYIVSYEIQGDGTLKNRKNFATMDVKQETDHGLVSGADGLCIDGAGNTVRDDASGRAGVRCEGQAPGKHRGAIRHAAAELWIRRSRQALSVCDWPRRRLESPDAERGREEPREVTHTLLDVIRGRSSAETIAGPPGRQVSRTNHRVPAV